MGATRGGREAISRARGGDGGWEDENNARETAARVGRFSARARRRGDDDVDGRGACILGGAPAWARFENLLYGGQCEGRFRGSRGGAEARGGARRRAEARGGARDGKRD